MIKAIKCVGVPVRDQQRALDFYTQQLGFRADPDGNQLVVSSARRRATTPASARVGSRPGPPCA